MDDRPGSAQSSGGTGGVQKDNAGKSGGSSSMGQTTLSEQPEKKLVQFAMVLVILQRMSTGIGALGFFWATTVVLANLANISNKTDFYFITIILLMETARNFSLGRNFERSLESPWTISDALKGLGNKVSRDLEVGKTGGDTKTSTATLTSSNEEDLPLLCPDADDLLVLSSNLRKVFYCLQLLSALSCITLSVVRVVQLSLGALIDPTSSKGYTNLKATVYVFYVLAFAQASLSLAEKAYWEWEITKLLDEVNRDCKELGMIPVTSFFYHAYSERVNGNIFDDLSQQLDLFSFASNLLNTQSKQQQLIGIRILHKFSTDDRCSDDTLRNIGTSMPVMEKLLYMLSWKKFEDAEIRQKAANIMLKLAEKRWNSFRLSGFPGALEYISALLDPASDVDERSAQLHRPVKQKCFAKLGINIVAEVSNDHDNCVEIAYSRRLLLKLLEGLEDTVLRDHSAKSLDNLCKEVGEDCFKKLKGVVAVAPIVLKALMRLEENEQLYQMLALTTKLFSFMTSEEAKLVLPEQTMIDEVTIKLIEILKKNNAILQGPKRSGEQLDTVRRTTCKAINLATDIMGKIEKAASTFKIYRMDEALVQIREATRSDMGHEFIHENVEMALKTLQLLAEG